MGPEEGLAGPDSEQEALAKLEGLSLSELLRVGQENLLRTYVARAMAGTLSHQEAAILRNLLRDNGMTAIAPAQMKTIEHQPQKQLPVFNTPDYED